MVKSPGLRVALGASAVSVWSPEIFGSAPARLREFLARVFSVDEVESLELRPARSFARIRYAKHGSRADILRKLSRALSLSHGAETGLGRNALVRRVDPDLVYLGETSKAHIRVNRVGQVLSTWRVRELGEDTLRLSHPWLRRRRDLVFRLEEELAATLGVKAFRASALTGAVWIRFDGTRTSPQRLAAELERAWPRLLGGLLAPPPQARLLAALGLAGLAYTGQYVVPALRPIAVASVALYSSPNVVHGVKQLRRGEVGLSALYSTGLAFMLVSGMPFTAGLMAALVQIWPRLAHRKLVITQRRVFAAHRRRPAWVRLAQSEGAEVEASVYELTAGDRVVVQSGEFIPVDGVVEEGLAAVVQVPPLGAGEVQDRSAGDAVAAGALLLDGRLTIRVERANGHTLASHLDSLLPHGGFSGLPSSLEAERIANRNAKPALAVSALSLLLTRTLPPSQGVIRPDYATAPRLSAQLAAVAGISQGWQRGIVFRNAAALDRLSAVQTYVFDDSAGLDRRKLEVAGVHTVPGGTPELVLGHAASVHSAFAGERGRALAHSVSGAATLIVEAHSRRRYAGVVRYRDGLGTTIDVASTSYLEAAQVAIPEPWAALVQAGSEAALQPLWILREGKLIGAVSFARSGAWIGEDLVAALAAAHGSPPRIVYTSPGERAEAQALAQKLGIEFSYGLNHTAKLALIRSLNGSAFWIGNGSEPQAKELIAASSVSLSVGPLSRLREDAADILVPHEGLGGLPDVLEIGREHAARLSQDYRVVYSANLLGAAGALFAAAFSPLRVGLISNLGTALVYARHAIALDRLAAAADTYPGLSLSS